MIEIRPFQLSDCIFVAEAHINYLTTPFRGISGIQLLRTYYEVIARQTGGIGFVAIKDGDFAGFVCGIWNRSMIKRSLLSRWDRLVIYGIEQSLQVPKMIPSLLRRLLNPYTMDVIKIKGYELRPIVVLPDYRGQGVADYLTLHLLEDAKQRGFKRISLVVEASNPAAEKFYLGFGFKLEHQINMAGNIVKLFSYSFLPDGKQ